jgi:hypothetical protein
MKKTNPIVNYLLFISGVVFLFTSCAPAYVPNTLNTPLMSNKGEIQAGLNIGLSGFDPQAAYAITDHLGVLLNGSFRNSTSDSSDSYHKHVFLEGGVGYFTKIGGIGRFETYGGYGYNQLQAYFDSDIWTDFADVTSNRIFIQPAIGISTSIFDGSFATRFVLVDMHQTDVQKTGFFFEPALTLKLGYKYVKGVLQLGLSYPFNSEGYDFNYQPILFSMGIQATLKRNYE